MASSLQTAWRRRRDAAPFDPTPTFRDNALTLGVGTTLLRLDAGRPRPPPPARDRLAALLVVAGSGELSPDALLKLDAAIFDWWRGERALAAIRLAFTPLPRLRATADAYPLFLAEQALDAGLTPYDLLIEFDYAPSIGRLSKFDPGEPRVPKESPGGGEWTGEGGAPTSSRPTPSREGRNGVRPIFFPGERKSYPTLFPSFPSSRCPPKSPASTTSDRARRPRRFVPFPAGRHFANQRAGPVGAAPRPTTTSGETSPSAVRTTTFRTAPRPTWSSTNTTWRNCSIRTARPSSGNQAIQNCQGRWRTSCTAQIPTASSPSTIARKQMFQPSSFPASAKVMSSSIKVRDISRQPLTRAEDFRASKTSWSGNTMRRSMRAGDDGSTIVSVLLNMHPLRRKSLERPIQEPAFYIVRAGNNKGHNQ